MRLALPLLLVLLALLAPREVAAARGLRRQRADAWQAHLQGADPAAVVALQDILARTSRPPHRGALRRAATQDLIRILALGALAEDPVGTLEGLPRRERQDALLDLAAAAFDGGQPGLAARAARAAVEADSDALMAPVGLSLLAMVHMNQRSWDLAYEAILERMSRFGVASAWASLSPAHAAVAALDRPDLEEELRRVSVSAHQRGKHRGVEEAWMARERRGEPLPDPGVLLLDWGRRDRGWIYDVIARNARSFQSCLTRARLRRPELAGALTLRFTLLPTGELVDAEVQDDTLGDAALSRCVLDVLGRLEFDAYAGSILLVRVPLHFPPLEVPGAR